MNKIVSKFLLIADKFMPELHLRHPGFTYSAYWTFTKHRERIQKFKGTGDLKHIYMNVLDKVSFAHDVAYSDSKDLAKRTISDKILKEKSQNSSKKTMPDDRHEKC